MAADIIQGMLGIFSGWNLLVILAGTAWGIFAGALPGITGAIGVALILPFTFGMEAASAIALLCASYCGSMFGGSISTILLGAPGTSSAAATLMDGRELHVRGKSGLAVGVALCASTLGGIFGSLVLMFFCTPLARVALLFGPPEYFALALFGLTVLSALSKDMTKGFIAGIFGMMVGTVGLDRFVGLPRYTLGMFELINGIEFLPAIIGMFALAEMFVQGAETQPGAKLTEAQKKAAATLPSLAMLWELRKSISIGAITGTIIGIMPGAGGAIGSWVAYGQARRFSRAPEQFGKGSLEGIAAPEAANNASEGGSLIPMLALGIPGSNTTAIMLGALTLQGLTPGPMLFTENPEVVYGVYGSTFLANFFMLGLGILVIRPVLLLTTVPTRYVVSCILILLYTASMAIKGDVFDVKITLVFGIIGLFMKRYNFSIAAAVLGLVLGPIIELSLQRSLLLSGGDPLIFLTRPVSCAFIILALLSFAAPLVTRWRKQRAGDNGAS